jgi:hypothetical protein
VHRAVERSGSAERLVRYRPDDRVVLTRVGRKHRKEIRVVRIGNAVVSEVDSEKGVLEDLVAGNDDAVEVTELNTTGAAVRDDVGLACRRAANRDVVRAGRHTKAVSEGRGPVLADTDQVAFHLHARGEYADASERVASDDVDVGGNGRSDECANAARLDAQRGRFGRAGKPRFIDPDEIAAYLRSASGGENRGARVVLENQAPDTRVGHRQDQNRAARHRVRVEDDLGHRIRAARGTGRSVGRRACGQRHRLVIAVNGREARHRRQCGLQWNNRQAARAEVDNVGSARAGRVGLDRLQGCAKAPCTAVVPIDHGQCHRLGAEGKRKCRRGSEGLDPGGRDPSHCTNPFLFAATGKLPSSHRTPHKRVMQFTTFSRSQQACSSPVMNPIGERRLHR